jgi:hypothetical protein
LAPSSAKAYLASSSVQASQKIEANNYYIISLRQYLDDNESASNREDGIARENILPFYIFFWESYLIASAVR